MNHDYFISDFQIGLLLKIYTWKYIIAIIILHFFI